MRAGQSLVLRVWLLSPKTSWQWPLVEQNTVVFFILPGLGTLAESIPLLTWNMYLHRRWHSHPHTAKAILICMLCNNHTQVQVFTEIHRKSTCIQTLRCMLRYVPYSECSLTQLGSLLVQMLVFEHTPILTCQYVRCTLQCLTHP